jgi:hypothetical protein
MAQRDRVTRRSRKGLGMHFPATWPTGRCPVQPSTTLGPDQANVLLLLYHYYYDFEFHVKHHRLLLSS